MKLCSICCNQKATYVLFLCYNVCSFRCFHKEILVVRLRLSDLHSHTADFDWSRRSLSGFQKGFHCNVGRKKYVRICKLSHVASRSI